MLYVYKYNFVGYVAFLPNFVVIVDQKTVVIHDVFLNCFRSPTSQNMTKNKGNTTIQPLSHLDTRLRGNWTH